VPWSYLFFYVVIQRQWINLWNYVVLNKTCSGWLIIVRNGNTWRISEAQKRIHSRNTFLNRDSNRIPACVTFRQRKWLLPDDERYDCTVCIGRYKTFISAINPSIPWDASVKFMLESVSNVGRVIKHLKEWKLMLELRLPSVLARYGTRVATRPCHVIDYWRSLDW
jgi:hypothetical protein